MLRSTRCVPVDQVRRVVAALMVKHEPAAAQNAAADAVADVAVAVAEDCEYFLPLALLKPQDALTVVGAPGEELDLPPVLAACASELQLGRAEFAPWRLAVFGRWTARVAAAATRAGGIARGAARPRWSKGRTSPLQRAEAPNPLHHRTRRRSMPPKQQPAPQPLLEMKAEWKARRLR